MSDRSPLSDLLSTDDPNDGLKRTALVGGSVALGAYLTGAAVRWARRSSLPPPATLSPLLDAEVRAFEMMEGEARYYVRPGSGLPLVLLHSFNAAASSHEWRPLFQHLIETTERPVYALDWLGFGLSDRPPVAYRPALYQRQLRRFLSEVLADPADLIALSLGCEYAATVTNEVPFLVRRLVLVAPTALGRDDEASLLQRALVGLAGGLGLFDLFFYRLTRRASLRQFFARQVFPEGTDVPPDLVDAAFRTAHVQGAPSAPRRFVDGSLFLHGSARDAYAHLNRPALLITPRDARGLVQRFERLDEVVARNPDHLQAAALEAGLLPQWDAPTPFFEHIDAFLETAADSP